MTQLAVAPFFQTNIAEVLIAAAAVLTFFAALGAIYYAHRQLSAALAADFITIKETGEERNSIADKRWKSWEAMERSDAAKIVLYLNHLEAVGGLYEQSRLDETATMRLFGQAAAAYWKRADWFVSHLRNDGSPAAFDKWEALAKAFDDWKQKGA